MADTTNANVPVNPVPAVEGQAGELGLPLAPWGSGSSPSLPSVDSNERHHVIIFDH